MKKFVRVIDNYDAFSDDFACDSCTQEELISVDDLVKIYKYKGGKPILAYVWHDPVSGLQREWREIFHFEKALDTRFDKLERLLC